MKSSNPILKPSIFAKYGAPDAAYMTIDGTVNKTAILMAVLLATAGFTWFVSGGDAGAALPWLFIGIIGGLVSCLATVFKKNWAPVTAPIYAAFEGLVIGGLSSILEAEYPGIAFQAAGLTIGVLFAMLFAYRARIIRATEKFKMGVFIATASIGIVYLASMVLGLFGVDLPYLHSAGPVGILISLVIVGVAALNLILDFDLIEQGSKSGAPQYMEWYGAFALMVTLIWLYIEILRLLSKLRSSK